MASIPCLGGCDRPGTRDEAEASSDAVDTIFSQLPTLGERRNQARAHNAAHNRTVPRLCRVRPSAQPDELLNVATGRAKLDALTADTLWAVSDESGDIEGELGRLGVFNSTDLYGATDRFGSSTLKSDRTITWDIVKKEMIIPPARAAMSKSATSLAFGEISDSSTTLRADQTRVRRSEIRAHEVANLLERRRKTTAAGEVSYRSRGTRWIHSSAPGGGSTTETHRCPPAAAIGLAKPYAIQQGSIIAQARAARARPAQPPATGRRADDASAGTSLTAAAVATAHHAVVAQCVAAALQRTQQQTTVAAAAVAAAHSPTDADGTAGAPTTAAAAVEDAQGTSHSPPAASAGGRGRGHGGRPQATGRGCGGRSRSAQPAPSGGTQGGAGGCDAPAPNHHPPPTQQDREKVARFLRERGKLHVNPRRRGSARLHTDQATELAMQLGGSYVVRDDDEDEEEADRRRARLDAIISEVRMEAAAR